MLRNNLSILQAELKQGLLSENDFVIDQINKETHTQLVVSFIPETEFVFDARINSIDSVGFRSKRVTVKVSPGIVLQTETRESDDLGDIKVELREWAKRIDVDLKARPAMRLAEELKGKVKQMSESFENLPNEYFTNSEADELRNRLDNFQQIMEENYKQFNQDQSESLRQIKNLKADISILKTRIESLTKPGWAKQFMVKVTGWMQDPSNRKLIASGYEAAKGLLLDSGLNTPSN